MLGSTVGPRCPPREGQLCPLRFVVRVVDVDVDVDVSDGDGDGAARLVPPVLEELPGAKVDSDSSSLISRAGSSGVIPDTPPMGTPQPAPKFRARLGPVLAVDVVDTFETVEEVPTLGLGEGRKNDPPLEFLSLFAPGPGGPVGPAIPLRPSSSRPSLLVPPFMLQMPLKMLMFLLSLFLT